MIAPSRPRARERWPCRVDVMHDHDIAAGETENAHCPVRWVIVTLPIHHPTAGNVVVLVPVVVVLTVVGHRRRRQHHRAGDHCASGNTRARQHLSPAKSSFLHFPHLLHSPKGGHPPMGPLPGTIPHSAEPVSQRDGTLNMMTASLRCMTAPVGGSERSGSHRSRSVSMEYSLATESFVDMVRFESVWADHRHPPASASRTATRVSCSWQSS